HESVFESGWVKLEDKWQNSELAESWVQLRQLRTEVNKVLEQARTEKAIGSSLEAKVLLYVADTNLRQRLQFLNPNTDAQPSTHSNGVDELRYLFITSGVELLDTPATLTELKYNFQSEALGIGVAKADGKKCDRCWNYSIHVGASPAHPLLCERCIPALAGEF
ncbi:MAG: zinc finger domain-containing protein, partial [Chroococcidiopsis sp.]